MYGRATAPFAFEIRRPPVANLIAWPIVGSEYREQKLSDLIFQLGSGFGCRIMDHVSTTSGGCGWKMFTAAVGNRHRAASITVPGMTNPHVFMCLYDHRWHHVQGSAKSRTSKNLPMREVVDIVQCIFR